MHAFKKEKKKTSIFPIQRYMETENIPVDWWNLFGWCNWSLYTSICSFGFSDRCTVNNS